MKEIDPHLKKFISFSGGVESSTMCVLFGKQADAIFSDTGFEHKEIYARLDLVENFVKSTIREDFKIHRIRNKKYNSLEDYIVETKFYPNFQARYCTRMFKIEPIDDWLDKFEECSLMIGLNADEEGQRTGNHGNKKNINYLYPLIDNKINRAMCLNILERVGMKPNFPPYMQRGGCIGCYLKSSKEYEAMSLLNPEEFKRVEDLEKRIQDKREDFFSIKQGRKMSDIREGASKLFEASEMYPTINNVTQCGVFCNR